MKILRARLYAIHEEERRKKQEEAEGEKLEIAWGSQIRSYVLHPYQLVKDIRTVGGDAPTSTACSTATRRVHRGLSRSHGRVAAEGSRQAWHEIALRAASRPQLR